MDPYHPTCSGDLMKASLSIGALWNWNWRVEYDRGWLDHTRREGTAEGLDAAREG